jgi:hypothetical protein
MYSNRHMQASVLELRVQFFARRFQRSSIKPNLGTPCIGLSLLRLQLQLAQLDRLARVCSA